jgi:hypothetical protein
MDENGGHLNGHVSPVATAMMIAGFLLLAAAHVSSSGLSTQTGRVSEHPFLSELEKELIEEIGLVRSNPGNYRHILERNRIYYRGKKLEKPGSSPIVTKEGVAALDEAAMYLGRVQSSPLSPCRGACP